jgi:chromatin remodeling complex protein RSC6
MARTKTTTKTSSSVESVPVIESVSVVDSVPVMESASVAPKVQKVKKVKAPKETETIVATQEVESVVVDEIQVDVSAPESDAVPAEADASLTEQSTEFLAKLGQISTLLSSLKTEYRILEKKWTKELKVAQKLSSKRKRKAGNRAPSGFVKPTRISDELATFLGKDKGAEMARTAVTRDINNYIRTNKLQDTTNGRKINPDAKLAALLKLNKTDELTYFNLQKYMSHHFAKNVKVVEAEVVSA